MNKKDIIEDSDVDAAFAFYIAFCMAAILDLIHMAGL